jgi:deoxyribose-phosphate aldolase
MRRIKFMITKENFTKMVDHSILKVDVNYANIKNFCEETIKYNFTSVAIFPYNIPLCAKLLKGTDKKIVAALAFPLGDLTPEMKAFETKDAIAKSGDIEIEVDLVTNVQAIKSGKWEIVKKELEMFRKAAKGHIAKLVLENCFLTDEEKVKICKLAVDANLDFVSTSTGTLGGATLRDINLMRDVVGGKIQIKASGRISTAKQVRTLIEAGATRIGCSDDVYILENW